jgi:hypothetical protein
LATITIFFALGLAIILIVLDLGSAEQLCKSNNYCWEESPRLGNKNKNIDYFDALDLATIIILLQWQLLARQQL